MVSEMERPTLRPVRLGLYRPALGGQSVQGHVAASMDGADLLGDIGSGGLYAEEYGPEIVWAAGLDTDLRVMPDQPFQVTIQLPLAGLWSLLLPVRPSATAPTRKL